MSGCLSFVGTLLLVVIGAFLVAALLPVLSLLGPAIVWVVIIAAVLLSMRLVFG